MHTLQKKLVHSFDYWFPIVVAITLLLLALYCVMQFSLRSSANDPQVQVARDMAHFLEQGVDPQMFNAQVAVPIESSLSPYAVIYDAQAMPVAGYGALHGALPKLPLGVYDHAKTRGEHRVTWQPERGVREAVVIRYYENGAGGSGYVLAGRSLSETERRMGVLCNMLTLFWLVTVFSTIVATLALRKK